MSARRWKAGSLRRASAEPWKANWAQQLYIQMLQHAYGAIDVEAEPEELVAPDIASFFSKSWMAKPLGRLMRKPLARRTSNGA
mgnify:CR=1 FL=1